MPFVRPWKGTSPKIAESVFLAENAVVIGDVEIAADAGIWYGCVVRGDVFHIRIGERTNIQDGTIIHVTTGTWPTLVGPDVTVGHHATLHGCEVKGEALIGMGSTVMDGAVIAPRVVVGAGALVPPGMKVPEGSLVVGAPAKVKRDLTQGELDWIAESAKHYVRLAAEHKKL